MADGRSQGRVVANTAFNVIGLGGPLIVALVTIPGLVEGLGSARFGVLTLVWAVTSYFGLFDLGFGRALTHQLAVVIEKGKVDEVGPLCTTALVVMGVLGAIAGVGIALLVPLGGEIVRSEATPLELASAAAVLAVALPFVVLTSGFRAIMEAQHAFALLNLIRLPMGVWIFIGPWLAVVFGYADLGVICGLLAAGRIVGCLFHAWYAVKGLSVSPGSFRFSRCWFVILLQSGGWLTLSNIVSPLMGYVDRFIIGATLSAASVAYYATPQELVTKLWILPGALTAVLFPTFAAQIVRGDASAWVLFDRAVGSLYIVLLPITAGLGLFSKEILTFWIGREFGENGSVLLSIFAAGIFVNCLAHIPLTWLQSAGLYRAPALLQLAELPIFIGALSFFSVKSGLLGAAWVWFWRVCVDSLAMFALCLQHREGLDAYSFLARVSLGVALGGGVFLGVLVEDWAWRMVLFVVVLIASMATLYSKLALLHLGRKVG